MIRVLNEAGRGLHAEYRLMAKKGGTGTSKIRHKDNLATIRVSFMRAKDKLEAKGAISIDDGKVRITGQGDGARALQ